MKFKASDLRLNFTETGKPVITLTTDLPRQEALSGAGELQKTLEKGKPLTAEIKPWREKRSRDANSYLWVICQKIAEVLGTTKEKVYQKFIRDVGQWEDFPIIDEAVETFIRRWNHRGLGDFAEVQRPSKIEGYTVIRAYYGSSCYDTREMSVLIDEMVTQAKELNIETLPPAEIASMKDLWGDKTGGKTNEKEG